METKLFEIGKLFEKVSFKKLPYKAGDLKENIKCADMIPVLTAGIENQGLAYYAPKEKVTILKNVISVSANGANSGAMFYQPYDFTVLQDSYAIQYKGKKLNESEYLYMLTVLQKVIKNNYDWTNKAGWNRIKKLKIELPVNPDESINFNAINQCINKYKCKHKSHINKTLKNNNLSYCELTEDEEKSISDFFNGRIKMGCKKVGELFEVVYNSSLDKSQLKCSKNGEYPYFTRTINNNGIAEYVEYFDEGHKIRGNSIAVGLLQMSFFYMEHDFYAGQFTKTIFPKFDGLNENVGLFFVALFNKQSEKYKSFLVRDFDMIFKESEIEVPIDASNNLDFKFINNFMSGLRKQSLNSLKL